MERSGLRATTRTRIDKDLRLQGQAFTHVNATRRVQREGCQHNERLEKDTIHLRWGQLQHNAKVR